MRRRLKGCYWLERIFYYFSNSRLWWKDSRAQEASLLIIAQGREQHLSFECKVCFSRPTEGSQGKIHLKRKIRQDGYATISNKRSEDILGMKAASETTLRWRALGCCAGILLISDWVPNDGQALYGTGVERSGTEAHHVFSHHYIKVVSAD